MGGLPLYPEIYTLLHNDPAAYQHFIYSFFLRDTLMCSQVKGFSQDCPFKSSQKQVKILSLSLRGVAHCGD